jgi:hypothetical protein
MVTKLKASFALCCLLAAPTGVLAHSLPPAHSAFVAKHAVTLIAPLAKRLPTPLGLHNHASFIALNAGNHFTQSQLSLLLGKGNNNLFRNTFASGFGSLGFPLSLSTRAALLQQRTIIEGALKAGMAAGGGTPVGGQLQGDIYFFNGSQYQNQGEYIATLTTAPSTNPINFAFPGDPTTIPGFNNTISFATKTLSISKSGFAPPTQPLFSHLSGSLRALLSQRQALAQSAFNSARPFFGGSLSGGEFSGTYFATNVNTPGMYQTFGFKGPSPKFVFAFGSDPLNNPANAFGFINIPNPSSYILASGFRHIITGGQIAVKIDFKTNIFGPFNGLFAIGNSPLNTGLVGSTTVNPAVFLHF